MIPPLFAIITWPLVVGILFLKLKIPMALLISITAGYLLLPEKTKYDLPFLPVLDKNSIPAIATIVMSSIFMSRSNLNIGCPGWIPKHWLARSLLGLFVFGAFMTAITNNDLLIYGPRFIRPMGIYDAFSTVLSGIIFLLPLIIARKFLADSKTHRIFLLVLCVAGLLYSLPTLYEVRMSPQLNIMVYGFFQHSWLQHIREGGFRPLVFLNHGLWVAIVLSATLLATLGVFRTMSTPRRWIFLCAAAWLLMTLVLAKSLGALIITLFLAPIVLFLGTRSHLLVAAAIAVLVLAYPLARSSGLVPIDRVLAVANSISPTRARSLNTRLVNEKVLLAKASERSVFGWGGYGRSRIYNAKGQDHGIIDGYWVIVIGLGGWVRYLAEFGLLTVPILLLSLRRRRYDIGLETSILTVILAGNLFDMLPNATLTPLTWMMAGALWGRLELQKIDVTEPIGSEARDTRSRHRYRSGAPGRGMPEVDPAITTPDRRARSYTRQRNKIYRQKKPDS